MNTIWEEAKSQLKFWGVVLGAIFVLTWIAMIVISLGKLSLVVFAAIVFVLLALDI